MTQSEFEKRGRRSTGHVYLKSDDVGLDVAWIDLMFASGRVARHMIDGDQLPMSSDEDEDFAEDGAELQGLFFDLEMKIHNDDDRTALSFLDIDGEEVFFKPETLSAVVTPLVNIAPALREAILEGDDENGIGI